jgi:hypothetical protein
MIWMAIVPVRQSHRVRTRSPQQSDDIVDLVVAADDAAVRPTKIHAPLGAEDATSFFRLGLTLVSRAVGAQFSTRQIAQSNPESECGMQRHRTAQPDLDVVGMRAEDEKVNL